MPSGDTARTRRARDLVSTAHHEEAQGGAAGGPPGSPRCAHNADGDDPGQRMDWVEPAEDDDMAYAADADADTAAWWESDDDAASEHGFNDVFMADAGGGDGDLTANAAPGAASGSGAGLAERSEQIGGNVNWLRSLVLAGCTAFTFISSNEAAMAAYVPGQGMGNKPVKVGVCCQTGKQQNSGLGFIGGALACCMLDRHPANAFALPCCMRRVASSHPALRLRRFNAVWMRACATHAHAMNSSQRHSRTRAPTLQMQRASTQSTLQHTGTSTLHVSHHRSMVNQCACWSAAARRRGGLSITMRHRTLSREAQVCSRAAPSVACAVPAVARGSSSGAATCGLWSSA